MSQIFKKRVPLDILYDLLNSYSYHNSKYYLVNDVFFKKLKFDNILDKFLNTIKPYYFESKKFYVERNMTYVRFTTIIRQICKLHELHFSSKILYDRSKYNINYYIYKNRG
jgi:hypothetical protein